MREGATPHILVVGGVNVDISGTADSRMLLGDSNPGRVSITLGGVGRNIAECLTRLGAEVGIITALGEDVHTAMIRQSCEDLGIDLSLSECVPHQSNSLYLCLNDVNGDVFAAVSDMEVCECVTPAFLERRMEALNRADLVVVDANIPEESVRFLAEHCRAPLAADPVSVKKAERLKASLASFALIKPNRPEAELLSGRAIRGMDGLREAADTMLAGGLGHVFISLGGHGVYYDDGHMRGTQRALAGEIVNTNGCGDAFLAAACLAYLHGADTATQALWGQAAAAINAECDAAVNPALQVDAVRERMALSCP